jgi:hypothetical protein
MNDLYNKMSDVNEISKKINLNNEMTKKELVDLANDYVRDMDK